MSEARQGMNQQLENPRDNDGGFWIRREIYPMGVTRTRRRQAQSLVATTDNKENIPPSPAMTVRRCVRTRRSPLPHWYPRTPLRDVTVIVNALERRRKRMRAAIQRRSFNPEPPSTRGPVADDMNSSNHTAVSEVLPSDVSDTSPSQAVSSSPSISPIQHLLDSSSSNTLSTPGGHFPSPISVLINSSSAGPKPADFEKKLQGTIAEIERLVLENLKKTPKQPVTKATHTLMLMR